jgi:multiple sugar transport system ATP-binding protein
LLNLSDVLDRRPGGISIGQAQRVAIGRALIRKPRLLLLDEPLNNLDLQLSLKTRAVLKRLQRDLGITTIYVTHDQEEAQSLADKIVVMHLGRVQQIGSPKEIYDDPANQFVAGFIGTPPMNFMHCQIQEAGGFTRLVSKGGFALSARAELLERFVHLPNWEETVLGIRPERITFQMAANDHLPEARVHTIEPEGNEAIISVRVAEDTLWKVRTSKEAVAGLQLDMTIYLNLDQSKLHLFDPHTSEHLASQAAQVV